MRGGEKEKYNDPRFLVQTVGWMLVSSMTRGKGGWPRFGRETVSLIWGEELDVKSATLGTGASWRPRRENWQHSGAM